MGWGFARAFMAPAVVRAGDIDVRSTGYAGLLATPLPSRVQWRDPTPPDKGRPCRRGIGGTDRVFPRGRPPAKGESGAGWAVSSGGSPRPCRVPERIANRSSVARLIFSGPEGPANCMSVRSRMIWWRGTRGRRLEQCLPPTARAGSASGPGQIDSLDHPGRRPGSVWLCRRRPHS